MNQSIHEYVVAKLQATKGRWPTVAKGSGVSMRTFSKVARGETRYPRVDTVERLAAYFRDQEK